MIEIRFAKQEETPDLKEMWKLCFGDDDQFIDFYFSNRFNEDEVVLLIADGKISAMLTVINTLLVTSQHQSYQAGMLYAIATHPHCQHKGYATELIKHTEEYLLNKDTQLTILVPADKNLFHFYQRQGYEEFFYLNQLMLTRKMIEQLVLPITDTLQISSLSPEDYNARRNQYLGGSLHIAYENKEISYQKVLSQHSGAEIYALDFKEVLGCAVVERVNNSKVLIKEFLLPASFYPAALKELAQLIPAEEYLIRTPAAKANYTEGSIQPFGMIKNLKDKDLETGSEGLAYLGLAFD